MDSDIEARDGRPTLILVDGTCLACNRIVELIMHRDRRGLFRFAHLQGAVAREVLRRQGVALDIDTIYAVTDHGGPGERVHVDGAAGRRIWPRIFPIAVLLYLVPLPLLNLEYRLFARFRYRLFGQAPVCILPSPQERGRFVEAEDGTPALSAGVGVDPR